MNDFRDGEIVIVATSQAGTMVLNDKTNCWVLLANGDIWTGAPHDVRYPQDDADLAACPLNFQRLI